jgi:hypothetical protein
MLSQIVEPDFVLLAASAPGDDHRETPGAIFRSAGYKGKAQTWSATTALARGSKLLNSAIRAGCCRRLQRAGAQGSLIGMKGVQPLNNAAGSARMKNSRMLKIDRWWNGRSVPGEHGRRNPGTIITAASATAVTTGLPVTAHSRRRPSRNGSRSLESRASSPLGGWKRMLRHRRRERGMLASG